MPRAAGGIFCCVPRIVSRPANTISRPLSSSSSSSSSSTMHKAPAAILQRPLPKDMSIHPPRDPNTLSNYNAWKCQHVSTEYEIDFDNKRAFGTASLTFKRLHDEADKIVLDTSFLDIIKVFVDGAEAKWNLAGRVEPYGSPLTIHVPLNSAGETTVDIAVSTTSKCTALQWLTPEQTPSGKHPYVFAQAQPIHARSMLPCQDTPDVKSTYHWKITSPLPVITSGLKTKTVDAEGSKKTYVFDQPIPIPSYLYSIVSGEFVEASIGPRSSVFAAPSEIKDAQWELEEHMEKYIKAAESIVSPYAWKTYSGVVLPPSFPFGGMETPQVTLLTPTWISRDRQNVDGIAHELSHSWSGNLVTNCSWEHFWLNEGWTTYLERRLQAAVNGEPHRDFSAIVGWNALSESIKQFGEDHEFTKLIVDLKGQDPDDAFSSIPYEKGFHFLYALEKLVGKGKWDKFIPHYFKTFERKSLDSYDFKATLLDFFAADAHASKALTDLDWDAWFYKPGFPPKPEFDTSLADVCYDLAKKWQALNTDGRVDGWKPARSDIDGWFGQQYYVLLDEIDGFEKPLGADLVDKLGKTYGFDQSYNVEILSRFYGVGLKARDETIYEPTAKLLGRVGRMKFVRPLYRGLKACDEKLAKETFERNRAFYHPICRGMVEKDLYGKSA